ncbi:bifunctional endo-1,4-beta-xylanase XylA-like isoform X2 [Passer montanus]|uniref:bifunctional endo-1,4-beta-xylanase XylA-like isoform X2 n=1 Tax=Passer montanus TaxID=9160 RepID=UPI00195FBC3C|nr:bifunctional endo-1,4-beta-xylanase XylA-like isoform X2 [Passer montanus]
MESAKGKPGRDYSWSLEWSRQRENLDWITAGVWNGVGKGKTWTGFWPESGMDLAKGKTWTGFQLESGMESAKGKPGLDSSWSLEWSRQRENLDWIPARVWNGVGTSNNLDWIPAGVWNGVGTSENLDWIPAGVWNGVGKRENPEWISAGIWNGLGKLDRTLESLFPKHTGRLWDTCEPCRYTEEGGRAQKLPLLHRHWQ